MFLLVEERGKKQLLLEIGTKSVDIFGSLINHLASVA
jgi:hypothetical protein